MLSLKFRKSPMLSPGTGYAPRSYGDNLPIIEVRVSDKPWRLVVDRNYIETSPVKPDIFVLGYMVPAIGCTMPSGAEVEVNRCYLYGWAFRNDVLAAPCDNRFTNENCRWSKMAFHIDAEKLRPIRELLIKMGVSQVPEETCFETIPQRSKLPMPSSLDIGPIISEEKSQKVADNFYKMLES